MLRKKVHQVVDKSFGFGGVVSIVLVIGLFANSGKGASSAIFNSYPAAYMPVVSKSTQSPLFVGWEVRWDGMGYLRGSADFHYDIGYHNEQEALEMTDADTIRVHGHDWYDPNPLDFEPSDWDSFYSILTGYQEYTTIPPNSNWKWSNPWIMPFEIEIQNGMTLVIDHQPFSVSGPYLVNTVFGGQAYYWKVINDASFLFYDDGSEWLQYVLPGDAVLWYEAGATRLLLRSDVLRTYYYEGAVTNFTVQYILELTASNAIDGTPLLIASNESKITVNKTSIESHGVVPSSLSGSLYAPVR